jgi:hypothetical protein
MRTALALLLIANVAAAQPVTVEDPIVSIVPTHDRLVEWCAASGAYDACTRFVAYRIEGECAGSGRSWTIDATASFRPFILLRNLHSLTHEKAHIEDLRTAVGIHMIGLRSLQFESHETCAARLVEEQRIFADRMRLFAEASNLQRHSSLRAAARRR